MCCQSGNDLIIGFLNITTFEFHKIKIFGSAAMKSKIAFFCIVVINKATVYFYFVELKGSDIQKAYNQIVTTLTTHLRSDEQSRRWGFIVASRVPKSGLDVNKLKNEFAKKHGKLLFIKNDSLVFDPEKGGLT